MVGTVPHDELLQFFSVASQCVQQSSDDRLEMREVVVRLGSIGLAAEVVSSEDGVSFTNDSTVSYVDEIYKAYNMSGSGYNISSSNMGLDETR